MADEQQVPRVEGQVLFDSLRAEQDTITKTLTRVRAGICELRDQELKAVAEFQVIEKAINRAVAASKAAGTITPT